MTCNTMHQSLGGVRPIADVIIHVLTSGAVGVSDCQFLNERSPLQKGMNQ